eukprot:4567188-Amphidinium_carterae.1
MPADVRCAAYWACARDASLRCRISAMSCRTDARDAQLDKVLARAYRQPSVADNGQRQQLNSVSLLWSIFVSQLHQDCLYIAQSLKSQSSSLLAVAIT